MSLADEFVRDAGGPAGSLADQFAADAAAPATGKPPPAKAQRPQPEPLSWWDQQLAKVPTGLVNNPAVAGARNITTLAASPMMGTAQLIANAMPDKAATLSDLVTGKQESVGELYNRKIAEVLRKDDQAAKENPATAPINRFVGGMISPANLAFSGMAPAATAGQRTIQGAIIGGAGGATSTVDVGDSGKYWGQKGAQTAIGAAGGAVLAPVMGYISDKVAARINAKGFDRNNAAKEADDIISGGLKEANQRLEDIPPDQLASVRAKVVDALSQGKRLDAAAAMRKADFDAEKVVYTQGQITRDPMQFADEQTMKSMSRPLSHTLELGNKQVMQGVTQYGTNAAEGPVAATTLADALRKYDARKQSDVSTAYATARASAGKDLEIPTQSLADAYEGVYKTFKDKVPTAVRDEFATLGKKPFTFESADDLRKIINANVVADPRDPTNAALNTLRSALNNAQKGAVAGGGPFAPAVKLAADHFAEKEAIPALDAAANRDVGDNFVSKHIIHGQTADVQKLAALLKKESPGAFQEARQQIGAELSRKAFGENVAADKTIAQESYNRALRNLGTAKLNAFFEPQEVEQLKRLGRLGAYQQSNPAAAASNFSNTAGALANLLRSGGGLPVAGKSLQTAGEKLGGWAATRPEIPVTANLTDEQRKALSRALTAITGGASIALPSRVVGE